MKEIPTSIKSKVILLIGLEGYKELEKGITNCMEGKTTIHATDNELILQNRKQIQKIVKKLRILNRQEEKMFLKVMERKGKKIDKIK